MFTHCRQCADFILTRRWIQNVSFAGNNAASLMHCRQRAQLGLACRWINCNGLLHLVAPRCAFKRCKTEIGSPDGRRISALQIDWWLRDRARQIRVKPLRVQTVRPRNHLRRHSGGRNRLCRRRRRAAARRDAGRRSLHGHIDHLSARI